MAVQGELPGVRIQLHFIPVATEEDYLEQMIRDALKLVRAWRASS